MALEEPVVMLFDVVLPALHLCVLMEYISNLWETPLSLSEQELFHTQCPSRLGIRSG